MKLDQYIDILREIHKTGMDEELRERLQCLITVLVTQSIAHRDSLDGQFNMGNLQFLLTTIYHLKQRFYRYMYNYVILTFFMDIHSLGL